METYKRVFVIVLDSLGIGAMPDSEKFGDKGVDTFGHILDKMGTLDIPNLQKLGMLNLHKGGSMEGIEKPIGRYMRIGEASNGKDTMTGHWEMMGIYTQKPFITFTETGFPKELIDELDVFLKKIKNVSTWSLLHELTFLRQNSMLIIGKFG